MEPSINETNIYLSGYLGHCFSGISLNTNLQVP